MPESKIGIFADVGAGYFLNKLPIPGTARWLGLTSRHIFGEKSVQLGLATHFVPFEKHADLAQKLLKTESFQEATELVEKLSTEVAPIDETLQRTIELYDTPDMSELIDRLQAAGLQDELSLFDQVCPMGVAVTNRNLQLAEGKTLDQVLKQEFRAMRYQQRDYNFIEGVRALLVTI